MQIDPSLNSERQPPPQFGLKVLFSLITLICVGLVLVRYASPYVLAVIVLIVVTVGAHVVASGVGHQLRAGTDERRRRLARRISVAGGEPAAHSPPEFAPTTQLSERQPLGRIVIIAPIVGGVAGVAAGAWGMAAALGEKARIANVSVAAFAAGVLGAIGAFLIATFLKALASAHAEALRHEAASRKRTES